MKTRDQIEEKYKWDLTEYYKNIEEWENEFERSKPLFDQLISYEDKLNNKQNLLECLRLERLTSDIFSKLYVYISLKVKEDGKNDFYLDKQNKLDKFYEQITPHLAYIATSLNEMSNIKLNKLIKDPDFKDYTLILKNAIKNKGHLLTKKEEEIISNFMAVMGGDSDVFDMLDAVDITFEDVTTSTGKKLPLNNANASVYLESTDPVLRETTYNNLNGAYANLNYTIGANYLNNIKSDYVIAKVRKFKSAFDQSAFDEDVSPKVFDFLVKNVHNHISVLHKYFEIKRKAIGQKYFYNYDVYTNLDVKIKTKYTYDQAFEIVKNMAGVFGSDYVSVLQRAHDERWIDVMPNQNKDTGAFSWGAYGVHPVVMLNFDGTINSVFTLAHELGHMMHTYYSNKNNPSTKASYEIFVAEVASTVNEMILAKLMLSNAKNKDEQLYFIDYLMSMFYSTLFRQTMFAEFEYNAHAAYESGGDVTPNAFNTLYLNLAKFYFGSKVKLSPFVKYEWSRIPHFYNSFYVYKYATGIICALAISNKILSGEKDAVSNYIKFLSSGCKEDPITLLKLAGADLTKEETFLQAFNFIDEILASWVKLTK